MRLKRVEKRENRQGIRLFSKKYAKENGGDFYILPFYFDQKEQKLLMTVMGSIDQR